MAGDDDDWLLGPACLDSASENEEDLRPPRLNLGEFSGDELDWEAVDTTEARPATSDSIDIGKVEETATFTSNPWYISRLAAQKRAMQRPVPAPIVSAPAEEPVKPIQAAFARQREKAAAQPVKKRELKRKRPVAPRMVTPPPAKAESLIVPATPRSNRRWTPPTPPESFKRPPSLVLKSATPARVSALEQDTAKFSRPLQDSPFRSRSPPPIRAALPSPIKSMPKKPTFKLMHVYEPPPARSSVDSLIPLPIVHGAGAIAPKPARRMHRPFRSPASLRPTPFVPSGDPRDSPFGAFRQSHERADSGDDMGWKRL